MLKLRPFAIAVQFLTRLPVRLGSAPGSTEMGQAVLFYPAVGTLVGAPLVLIGLAVAAGLVPHLVGAALGLAAWVVVTGGLHLDGLADSADAWAGGRGDAARALAIMKEPTSGPIGVTALLVVLLLKFAALADVLHAGHYAVLMLAPILGRTALPLLFCTTRYVRSGGLGARMSEHLDRTAAVAVVLASAALLVASSAMVGLSAVLAATLMFIAVRWLMVSTIGGTTGDTAGAMVELVEAASLAAIAVACR